MKKQVIEIEVPNAIKAYNKAPEAFKESLAILFGDVVTKQNAEDGISTWEDICSVLGRDPLALPDFSMLPENYQKYMLACIRIPYTVEAINGFDENGNRWTPNYNDPKQEKWYLWPDVKADEERPSGFALTGTFTYWTYTYTRVGARLTFRSQKAALLCFNNFNDWFVDLLLIPNK